MDGTTGFPETTLPIMPFPRHLAGFLIEFESMFDWNRQSLDFYRDRFLIPPVLLFSVLSIANILAPESPGDRLYGIELAVCSLVALLFAKDRLKVILAAAWFVALELAVFLVTTRDWKVYGAGFLIAVGTIVALFLTVRTWKSSYEERRKTSMSGILFVVAGFVAAAGVVLLLKPKQ